MSIQQLRGWFRTDTPKIDEVRPALWDSTGTGAGTSPGAVSPEAAQNMLLEQYKIYVEMADRISARRALSNAFFLTLNTGLLTGIGVVWREVNPTSLLVFALLIAGIIQASTWFWLIRSYRQLNAAKYVVIGALEERLPASPYWRAEWQALGEGKNPARYWPLTQVEQVLPAIFVALYVLGCALAIAGVPAS